MDTQQKIHTQKQDLISILTGHDWFINALAEVRKLRLLQWCIGAGIIRNIVFDHLQRLPNSNIRDVDVAYFDPGDLSENRDKKLETILRKKMPEIPWEVTNQAAVHLWYHKVFGYRVDPITNIEEAVSTWPETCTSVGVTLLESGQLKVIAPYGLDDLFNMVIRRNPKRVDIKTFNQRIQTKQYRQIWSSVKIIHELAS